MRMKVRKLLCFACFRIGIMLETFRMFLDDVPMDMIRRVKEIREGEYLELKTKWYNYEVKKKGRNNL